MPRHSLKGPHREECRCEKRVTQNELSPRGGLSQGKEKKQPQGGLSKEKKRSNHRAVFQKEQKGSNRVTLVDTKEAISMMMAILRLEV